ncbi:alpha/beta fold hydrolase [Paenibacillus sp. J2TS4]|uniref:alpha/beta fold hydrolase n=1 Tax=Paenibacillus sp. J2TS4 TaxID=2807194 RepID=UPI001B1831F1|nr:alpha/beta hydrolase [Paenibacillus sp. J2TS4]GIP31925.1 hypothetical protein J2TS4_11350 [Paenibacillus sp. J2TS4]
MGEYSSYRIPDGFNKNTARTLVLVGGREKKALIQSALALVQSNARCEGYVAPGIGHGISLANPDLFNQIIQAWMMDKNLPKEIEPLPI